MRIPEFTCLCPRPGSRISRRWNSNMCPIKLCVELKSLKLYVWSFAIVAPSTKQ